MKGGWKLRAKSHFAPIRGIGGIHGIVPGGHFFCAGCGLERHVLGIGHPVLSKTDYMPLGSPRLPPWQTQKEPKVGPRRGKGGARHPKESNKSQNYIHVNKIYANSRSTAIQQPASNVYCLLYMIFDTYVQEQNTVSTNVQIDNFQLGSASKKRCLKPA